METKTNSQTKARVLVVSVFVIGFAAGALSLNLSEKLKSSSKNKGPHGTDFIIGRMTERVGLSSEQQEQVKKILDETNEKYRDIRVKDIEPRIKDIEPRLNAVRQESRDRIRALLTPEQLPKYEQMTIERDKMREQEREKEKERQKQ